MIKSINIVILLVSLFTVVIGCKKDKFEKTTIFLEEFNDNSKGWYSKPDTSILYAPSECIKIENGQLKMHFERGLGISNCGGGWLEMELSNSSFNREEYFGTIGIKVKLNEGFIQDLFFIDSINGNNTYGHALLNSNFHFHCGKHYLTFPNTDALTDTIDLTKNKYTGSEFVFLSNTNWEESKIYIDGSEIAYEGGGTQWYDAQGNTFDFEFWFHIGYGQELMPFEIDLFIESIEIFTWEGEFCIDRI